MSDDVDQADEQPVENETRVERVEEHDPSVAIDESASMLRIEVHANGRALVLTVSEAEGLIDELTRALRVARRPYHPEGCMCSVCL